MRPGAPAMRRPLHSSGTPPRMPLNQMSPSEPSARISRTSGPVAQALKGGAEALFVRYDDLLRMLAEQVEQEGRVGGRHDLHRLPRLAETGGITQPVKRIAHLAQQARMDAPVGLLEADQRRAAGGRTTG